MPLRVAVCTSEFPMATQRSKLGGGVELCVATLGRLQAHLRGPTPSFATDNLLTLVVDEADSVFADDELRKRLKTLRASLPAGCATSLVTASLSPAVEEAIGREMEDAKLLAARDLHTTRPKVSPNPNSNPNPDPNPNPRPAHHAPQGPRDAARLLGGRAGRRRLVRVAPRRAQGGDGDAAGQAHAGALQQPLHGRSHRQRPG